MCEKRRYSIRVELTHPTRPAVGNPGNQTTQLEKCGQGRGQSRRESTLTTELQISEVHSAELRALRDVIARRVGDVEAHRVADDKGDGFGFELPRVTRVRAIA